MIRIFYHSADMDGAACGAILYQKYKDQNPSMHPINYGKPFPWDLITKDDTVIMADFSLQPASDMERLYLACGKFIWIDHHITAIEAVDKLGFQLEGIRNTEHAACALAYYYCYNTTKLPFSIWLLSEYDIWHKDNALWDKAILPLQYGLRVYDTNPTNSAVWDRIISDDKEFMDKMIADGTLILTYQKQMNESYIKSYGFETMLDGYRCLAVARGATSSQLFEAMWDEELYDMMMPFCILPAGGYTVSLYTTKTNVDCSKVAKNRGGGGHKQAAGFQCAELPFKLPVRA